MEMWQALEPGITEAQLWSHLHAGNIARAPYSSPGLTFREFAERSYQLPDRYLPNRYADIAHGLGLSPSTP